MKTMKMVLLSIILSFTANVSEAQTSGPQYFRSAVMNGNRTMTVFGNWGVIGQPNDNRPCGAWIYPSNGYIGDESFFVGVEFPIKDYNNDGKNDTVHSVITCPVSRPAKRADTDLFGNPWTFLPVDNSVNIFSQSVAISNNLSTWPASWNGQWKGINGNNSVSGDLEAYFQVNDMNDHRFDSSANNIFGINFTGRKGQGITVDVRYIQLNNPDFQDALIKVYDIKNENSFKYDKVVFGYLMGTYVGVTAGSSAPAEYDDDYNILYKKENVVITGDYPNDNSRNPFWIGSVGKVGSAFLLSPNNNHLASYYDFNSSDMIDLADDENLWFRLTPGRYKPSALIVNDLPIAGEDADYTMGTEYFSLNPGETKRIASVIAYGNTKEEIFQAIRMAHIFVGADFDFQKMSLAITIKSITDLINTKTIEWQTAVPGGTVDIYFSSDNGETYSLIAENEVNDGSFAWNTSSVADCYFGKFMLIAKDTSGNPIGFQRSDRIEINNASNGSPFLRMLTDMSHLFVEQPELNVSFLIGDPDNGTLTLKTYYSSGGDFVLAGTQAVQSNPINQNVLINFDKIPNSNSLKLKFELTDGVNTVDVVTPTFKKQVQRNVLPPANIQFISKNTTASVQVNVIDYSKTTNDTYKIMFCDSAEYGKKKTYTIKNLTKGTTVLDNKLLLSGTESEQFDGLTLMVNDVSTRMDSYTWSNNSTTRNDVFFSLMTIVLDPYLNLNLYPYSHPCDYKVVYYDHVVDTTLDYYGTQATPIKYKVFNTTVGKSVKVVANPEYGESFFFEKVFGKELYTWYLNTFPKNDSLPQSGDTLYINTTKGISSYDTLLVKNVALGVDEIDGIVPAEFTLFQNYPNPFNPTTSIRFALPSAEMARLKIFDVLGREIAQIAEGRFEAGVHELQFNAHQLASGIYFYSLEAGAHREIKKMILMK